MRYAKTVLLKSGVELLVRNAVASDARAVRDIMQRTHAETDYRLFRVECGWRHLGLLR